MQGLLVTGGAGFIGANFVHHCLKYQPGVRLVVLDALTYTGRLENLQPVWDEPALRFVRGNIADQSLVEKLLRDEKLDTIVHFAAESQVDRSIDGTDTFVYTNILGTHSLLKAARKVWLDERAVPTHRFHHVSTDEVYGSLGPPDPPFHECAPYSPSSPYSASKAASDHLVRAYHHTYGLEVTTSNCSNNYGPYHLPEKLIPRVIVNILHGDCLPIYGDGHNVRDWLHVSDHCRGIELILMKGAAGASYNIGGHSECENLELVHMLCRIADEAFHRNPDLKAKYPTCPAALGGSTASLITFVPDRPGHDRRHAVDCNKIRSDLGFRARISLKDGLRSTFNWYTQNTSWWQTMPAVKYRTLARKHPESGGANPKSPAELKAVAALQARELFWPLGPVR
jgi:dTDP-glucose 4,6-dehydratase